MSTLSVGSFGRAPNIGSPLISKVTDDIGPFSAPEPPPQSAVRADNAPENLFAKITKNGQLIANVYKSGLVEHWGGLPELSLTGSGLEAVKRRIAEIVKATGGQVSYQSGVKTVGVNANLLFQAQLASSGKS